MLGPLHMMQGSQFQLAPARPLGAHGAPTAPFAAPLPRISVSNNVLPWLLVWLLATPFVCLMLADTGVWIMSAMGLLCTIGALIGLVVSLGRARESRRLLATGARRLGTVADLQITRYPAGVYVNKSNISGYVLHLDVYDADRGASERRVLPVGRREWISAGTTVLVVVDGTRTEVAAFLEASGRWNARSPYKLE